MIRRALTALLPLCAALPLAVPLEVQAVEARFLAPWQAELLPAQRWRVAAQLEIRDLQRYCQHVYVDIPEVYLKPTPRTPAEKAVAEEVLQHKKVERDLLIKVASHPLLKPVYHDQTRLEQEIEAAREIHHETRELVYALLEDVRLGKNINSLGAKKVVAEMVESDLAIAKRNRLLKNSGYEVNHARE